MVPVRIAPDIPIDESELEFSFVHASGPGGQNVNKVATAVQVRLDVRNCPSLPEDLKRRLNLLAGSRVTEAGVLVLDARRYRSQARNRRDAVERLAALVREAAQPPKPRRPTRPTAGSVQRRRQEKTRRGQRKRLRGPVHPQQ